MNIDFFCGEVTVAETHFGICDAQDDNIKTPAFIDADLSNATKWDAEVKNFSAEDLYFNPVDNNIEIRRPDGSMDFRCDALLHNDYMIAFIELKNQRSGWIKHAVEEQLATTIEKFKEAHDISRFRQRRAYVCNKCHPCFHYSHKEYMQKFWSQYKIRLLLQRLVMVE